MLANFIPIVGQPSTQDEQIALARRLILVSGNCRMVWLPLELLRMPPTGDEEADLHAAVRGLRDAGAVWALVSVGRRGSLLGGPDGLWRLTSPVVNAVNAIGSGDALTAGLLHARIDQGQSMPDAAAFGTACGAANCITPTSGVIRPTDLPALLEEVRTTTIDRSSNSKG